MKNSVSKRARGWFMSATAGLLLASINTACGPQPEHVFHVETVASPAATGSAEPHLAKTPAGQVVLSWLEPEAAGTALRYSVLDETRWAEPRTVARGDGWFVNWADFPSVSPISDQLWAAHWLVKREGGTYAYDVAVALSLDGGESWGQPVTSHSDGTRTEHGFASLFPWQSGAGVIWLDGRNTDEGGHGAVDASVATSGMTLRSAVVLPDKSVVSPAVVDDLVCDCCQTDVAIAASGPIAVYRNRTPDEIRDIYVSRAIDGVWEAGRPIAIDGWQIAGCPVNGPAITTDDKDVAVAWFTAANDRSRVRFVRSRDSADSFSAPIDIDVTQPVGRVDVALLSNGDAVVSWLRGTDGPLGEFCIRTVSEEGDLGSVRVIAGISTGRLSGFPQMTEQNGDLVFAWTETSGDAPVIRTAIMKGFLESF